MLQLIIPVVIINYRPQIYFKVQTGPNPSFNLQALFRPNLIIRYGPGPNPSFKVRARSLHPVMQTEALETEVDAKRADLTSKDDYVRSLETRISELTNEHAILLKENTAFVSKQKILLDELKELKGEQAQIQHAIQHIHSEHQRIEENLKLFETRLYELITCASS